MSSRPEGRTDPALSNPDPRRGAGNRDRPHRPRPTLEHAAQMCLIPPPSPDRGPRARSGVRGRTPGAWPRRRPAAAQVSRSPGSRTGTWGAVFPSPTPPSPPGWARWAPRAAARTASPRRAARGRSRESRRTGSEPTSSCRATDARDRRRRTDATSRPVEGRGTVAPRGRTTSPPGEPDDRPALPHRRPARRAVTRTSRSEGSGRQARARQPRDQKPDSRWFSSAGRRWAADLPDTPSGPTGTRRACPRCR